MMKFFNLLILLLLSLIMYINVFAAQSAVFLLYHRFGDSRYPQTNIKISQFKAQLNLLKQGHYHVLPVPEIINKLQHHNPLPNKTIGIIIDDAYDTVYNQAWPLLQKYHFPFTLFVATDPVDKGYKDIMTWSQIKTLANAGVTIGNHSASHGHLAKMPLVRAIKDIKHAQRRLTDELGKPPTLFAYPYGEYSLALQQAIKKLGFKAAFMQVSGAAGASADMFALPRFAINEDYADIARFRLITQTLPLELTDVLPRDPLIQVNPPTLKFKVINSTIELSKLSCYASSQGVAKIILIDANQVLVKPKAPFYKGRARINCTLPREDGRFHWHGFYFWID